MIQPKQHVVLLGAGPSGCAAAYKLVNNRLARVTVLESQQSVGGNAGSFELDGIFCDYGSHRLHPAALPEIMDDLRKFMGSDMILQTRHGRILLKKHWIHFPLNPVDLLLRLPKGFALSVMGDMARKVLPPSNGGPDTFATVLERGLGRTICRDFYFPYARKLWGVAPEDLALTAAHRRVSGNSIGKILGKVAKQIPGLKAPTAGKFYYFRRGYGQMSESYYNAATREGAQFKFGARVTDIECDGNRVNCVRYQQNGQTCVVPADSVWSSIPITRLINCIRPKAPTDIVRAASSVAYRGMILIYLVLDKDQFAFSDAHYFPEAEVPISRISEPKNFTRTTEPRGRTVLCAEFPCDPGQPEWELSDVELGKRLCNWIESTGLPRPAPVAKVVTHRLRQAYPVYRKGFEQHFTRMDEWLDGIHGLLTFGRQGLFAHDNAHHTIEVAYKAVECLSPDGRFDGARWAQHRKDFETHVVED